MRQDEPRVVVIVGAGPRGTCVVERLAANAAEYPEGPVEIHLVDPYPPGPGRVWRETQHPELRLNSTAEDVSLFTDESTNCAGPVRPGPSIAEWAELVRAGELPAPVDGAVADEVRGLGPLDFPTRRLGSAYLTFVLQRTLAQLPPSMSVVVHEGLAVDLRDGEDGRQLLFLAGRDQPLAADAVVLTQGHLNAEPDGDQAELTRFAARHGLVYLPPAYGADISLAALGPGTDVIVRGFGLALVDLLVLLTEARGGRFVDEGGGRLHYLPSGEEPRLWVGSRRGVPYRCKPGYRLQGGPLDLPRFFSAEAVDALLADHEVLDIGEDVVPMLDRELAWGYYQELFAAHPERVRTPWPHFAEAFAAAPWPSAEVDALVVAAVPAPEDRLDIAALDRPLAGLRLPSHDALQVHLRAHVRADIDRRGDPAHSADLGGFFALLSSFAQLPRVLTSPAVSGRSLLDDYWDGWFGFFSYYASGPPPRRLEELLALSEAGVVQFVGAGQWVVADEDAGCFRTGGATAPGVVEAAALVEARLPRATVRRSTDRLLRALEQRGEVTEVVVCDDDGSPLPTGQLRVNPSDLRLVDRDGRPHPRRFAAGPHTSARAPVFARPRTGTPAHRQTDALARAVLQQLADHPARPVPAGPATGPTPYLEGD